MTKVFLVSGLDCANCAEILSRKISKVEGVTTCTINFMNKKMILEHTDSLNFEKIVEICRVFEDGVSLTRIR
ncbi:MAG: heavy-metal-associated domain-containing protein [Candidatus Onthovivens sp.]|nr:heavy-metal-associated domain-containing protein [Candidatus Onthovivens sp.]